MHGVYYAIHLANSDSGQDRFVPRIRLAHAIVIDQFDFAIGQFVDRGSI